LSGGRQPDKADAGIRRDYNKVRDERIRVFSHRGEESKSEDTGVLGDHAVTGILDARAK
jgi:hypothetical protein